MVVRNLTTAQHITLADGTELYNGSIVLLADSETIKYILHFGDYVYESTIHSGAYFYSIPDGAIVPAEGAALDDITVISNGHSEFPPTPPEDEDDPVVVDIATDDKSIEIADNKLKLKDFLTKYYKLEDEEQVEVEGFSDNLRPIAVQDGDSYKLAWIRDKRVQEIGYDEVGTDVENEYPSIKAILQDKLLSIDVESIIPEDLPKNVTLNALLEYENKNHVSNPNLWELSPGWYLSRGVINTAPETPLDNLTVERVILVSNAVVAAPFYVYVAVILPTEISGQGSGASMVYCFYDKTSSDPEDFSCQVEHILTSGIVETDISETDNRIPTSLAVVNYVEDKVPTHVEDPVLHDLDTGVYVVSGELDYDDIIDDGSPYSILADSAYLIVSSVTLPSCSNAKLGLLLNTFPNVVGDVDVNSAVTSFLVAQVGNEWTGAKQEYLSESHLTTSLDMLVDNEHIPTAKAVKDYVDNLISAINGGSY